jgi:hypothetical protein
MAAVPEKGKVKTRLNCSAVKAKFTRRGGSSFCALGHSGLSVTVAC